MSNKKQLTRRRAATFVAALGMLVMSSGVALMVAASPANAVGVKVGVCHATNSDSNPYVYIEPDASSVLSKGHLQHRNDPNKTWKSAGTFNGVPHQAGDAKPDLISNFSFNGTDYVLDGVVTAATCDGGAEPPEVLTAVADVEFQDPDCDNQNVADFEVTAENATWEITSGEAAPGASITITFEADENAAFEEDAQTVFTHQFGPVEICDIVLPPTPVVPGAPTFVDPTCDTDPQVILPEPAPVDEPDEISRKAELIDTQDIDGVRYVVTGDLVPGGTVDVDASALEGYEIEEGATTHWTHTFTMPEGCEAVEPPVVDPPVVDTPEETVTTPSVVSAGLAEDLRGEQGLALLVVGMIMMVVAGGLGVRTAKSEL